MTARERLRRVVLLHPFDLPIVLSMLVVAVVFTLFPDTLEHSAVSFENRGIVHHVFFHYALLTGSLLALVGLFNDRPRGRVLKVAGFTALLVAITMNLSALVIDAIQDGTDLSGLTVGNRGALIVGLAVRIWITLAQPTVAVPVRHDV